MTNTKRMPKPMTEKQIVQYQELKANLMAQAELIMSIFHPLDDMEHITEVKFYEGHPDWPSIDIWYQISHWDEDSYDCFPCPESYLGMTEDELRAEKKRLEEEEERKRAERAAKAKAVREKRKAEKAKKERGKRYEKYLELKKEFEGENDSEVTSKPKKESVYVCKCAESYYDDYVKCTVCHSKNSKIQICDCKRIYAQQFCPFYEKGELRGKWVISDEDKQAAEEFKKEFECKEQHNAN